MQAFQIYISPYVKNMEKLTEIKKQNTLDMKDVIMESDSDDDEISELKKQKMES